MSLGRITKCADQIPHPRTTNTLHTTQGKIIRKIPSKIIIMMKSPFSDFEQCLELCFKIRKLKSLKKLQLDGSVNQTSQIKKKMQEKKNLAAILKI